MRLFDSHSPPARDSHNLWDINQGDIPGGDGEGGVDPAVGVHDAGWDVVDDAVDGVPDEGLRGDEEVGGEDEEHRRLAVQLENRVVDSDLDNWPGVSSDSD